MVFSDIRSQLSDCHLTGCCVRMQHSGDDSCDELESENENDLNCGFDFSLDPGLDELEDNLVSWQCDLVSIWTRHPRRLPLSQHDSVQDELRVKLAKMSHIRQLPNW